MKKIAILITVFNRKQQTLSCLKRLFEQEIPDCFDMKVYLTDDGSTDGTAKAVQECFPNKVSIIHGDGSLFWNRGMWTAWNYAVKEGHFDFFLWLNDDTDLYKNALKTLLDSSAHNDNMGIIVGATVDTKMHQYLTYGGRLIDGRIPICDGEDCTIDYFNGNIVLIPNSVYQQLGNLDYYFTHSKGDFDYGLRAKERGIKMLQCGKVLGECDLHSTTDKWCDPRLPLSTRLKWLKRPNGMPPKETFYLNRKHSGLFSAVKAYFTIYLRCFWPQIWVRLGKLEIK